MGKLLLEYAIVALLLICLIASAFVTHSDKLLAPFRTINAALSRGARQ